MKYEYPRIKQIMPCTKKQAVLMVNDRKDEKHNIWLSEIIGWALVEDSPYSNNEPDDYNGVITYIRPIVQDEEFSWSEECETRQWVKIIDVDKGEPTTEELWNKYKNEINEVADKLMRRRKELHEKYYKSKE